MPLIWLFYNNLPKCVNRSCQGNSAILIGHTTGLQRLVTLPSSKGLRHTQQPRLQQGPLARKSRRRLFVVCRFPICGTLDETRKAIRQSETIASKKKRGVRIQMTNEWLMDSITSADIPCLAGLS